MDYVITHTGLDDTVCKMEVLVHLPVKLQLSKASWGIMHMNMQHVWVGRMYWVLEE